MSGLQHESVWLDKYLFDEAELRLATGGSGGSAAVAGSLGQESFWHDKASIEEAERRLAGLSLDQPIPSGANPLQHESAWLDKYQVEEAERKAANGGPRF